MNRRGQAASFSIELLVDSLISTIALGILVFFVIGPHLVTDLSSRGAEANLFQEAVLPLLMVQEHALNKASPVFDLKAFMDPEFSQRLEKHLNLPYLGAKFTVAYKRQTHEQFYHKETYERLQKLWGVHHQKVMLPLLFGRDKVVLEIDTFVGAPT